MMHETEVICPYCGEGFTTVVDCSAGNQQYIEDCEVCCNPIVFSLTTDSAGNLLGLEAHQDNE